MRSDEKTWCVCRTAGLHVELTGAGAERSGIRRGGTQNAGMTTESVERLRDEVDCRRALGILRRRQRDTRGHDTRRIRTRDRRRASRRTSGRAARRRRAASPPWRSANHQQSADAVGSNTSGGTAPFFQRAREVGPTDVQHRQHREQDGHDERDAAGGREHSPIDRDVLLSLGTFAGNDVFSRSIAMPANNNATTVPRAAIVNASTKSCMPSRTRPAPMAVRSASSRSRPTARTRNRLVTFAQAIRSTNVAALIRIQRAGRTCAVRSSTMPTTCQPKPRILVDLAVEPAADGVDFGPGLREADARFHPRHQRKKRRATPASSGNPTRLAPTRSGTTGPPEIDGTTNRKPGGITPMISPCRPPMATFRPITEGSLPNRCCHRA